MSSTVWIITAFAAYMIMMIAIGAIYMKKTNNSEDYFLGGRGLGGWVAALSAQASDMSGWLLMGLPGAVYAYGTDCYRSFDGNHPELGLCLREAAPLYDSGQ